ncbi:hypothetical protein SPRG_19071 [Saprolegnia parasitica CBS 223.65]|uniref:Uncharacterized protein n=1 Tax=Saprolegnia parasitica (strain CBS 223.65) TaxID=695850 RepID=A0A067CUS2_SAPPC|nr:hypothetical protein SPRG_19071 [Saprolegnia parasitica CBS 223.65]KDO34233.1 hypothetical protein SPRG_19071 [Saprolegnia parasitica CBS 223.65]|eukprot:XP_012195267.1 hypothetical protein SPRG_19071 [Saprolegnia parasitica CBS 223.65]
MRRSLPRRLLSTDVGVAPPLPQEQSHVEQETAFVLPPRKPKQQPTKPSAVRYQVLRADATLAATGHVYAEGCLPGVFFYKYLASIAEPSSHGDDAPALPPPSHLQLRCWIPDTIIFGGAFPPLWLYSDKSGVIRKSIGFVDTQVMDKLGNRRFENDPVVLFKEPVVMKAGLGHVVSGNHVKLLSTIELRSALTKAVGSPVTFALQKYVKPRGPKAFLVRAIYKAGKAPTGWMINNKAPFQTQDGNAAPDVRRFCASTGVYDACSFVKLSERACTDVYDINLRIVKYLEQALRVALELFAADFIKDDFGQWWLIQVKAFQLKHVRVGRPHAFAPKLMAAYERSLVADDVHDDDDASHIDTKAALEAENAKVHKMFPCKFCQVPHCPSELAYKMTMKMMHETIARLSLRAGSDQLHLYLAEPKYDLDAGLFYQTWNVCNLCYALYERDQLLLQVEAKFSIMLGCPTKHMAGGGVTYITEHDVCKSQPLLTDLPTELTLCRLMFFFTALYDIPKELYESERASDPKPKRSRLYLRFSVLGYDNFIPLDAQAMRVSPAKGDASSTAQSYWLPLNIMRCFHCFAPKTPLQSKVRDTSGLGIYLADESAVTIELIRTSDTAHVHNEKRERIVQWSGNKWAAPHTVGRRKPALTSPPNKYNVVLGSTSVQMFQFRSSYVTKTDVYASLSMGDLFNLKGNVGFERLRVIQTRHVLAQYKLRQYCGVYVPDTSFCTNDKLASEWMDSVVDAFDTSQQDVVVPKAGMDLFLKTLHGSSASLASSQADSELEDLVEASSRQPPPTAPAQAYQTLQHLVQGVADASLDEDDDTSDSDEDDEDDDEDDAVPRERTLSASSSSSGLSTWCITIMLHRIHNWDPSPGRRGWEAQYTFLGQVRRAAQKLDEDDIALHGHGDDIVFDSTHKNYVQGGLAAIQLLYEADDGLCRVALVHPDDDERPFVDVELSGLKECRTIDGTFTIQTSAGRMDHATKSAQYPPYLSVSVYVLRVGSDAKSERGFVASGSTPEGLVLLRRLP